MNIRFMFGFLQKINEIKEEHKLPVFGMLGFYWLMLIVMSLLVWLAFRNKTERFDNFLLIMTFIRNIIPIFDFE